MSSRVNRLLSVLEEAIQLLQAYGVSHWSEWLSNDASQIRHSDSNGIDHLLAAFGGMGSLNDIWICPENGHKIGSSDVHHVNAKLNELTTTIFTLATSLKHKSPNQAL